MWKDKLEMPKQWKHWCRQNGLYAHNRRKNARGPWLYLKGRGHVWRVNALDLFQRGDSMATFDRWALCQDIYQDKIPATEAEFKDFIKRALATV